MKKPQLLSLVIAGALALGVSSVKAALVTVSSIEVWNGIENPHAADGVSVSGSGTTIDPYIYYIPDGMTISSTGVIRLTGNLADSSDSYSIGFQFGSGNLQIDAGGYVDCGSPDRNVKGVFRLDLGGGSVTGSGTIVGIDDVRTPFTGTMRVVNARRLEIINVADVSLVDVDLHTENVNATGLSSIVATGNVMITGTFDTSDIQGAGGSAGSSLSIGGSAVTVNNIDTRSLRPDANAGPGSITLQALVLSFGVYYDPDSPANAYANQVVVKGAINATGVGPGGNVSLDGVVVRLEPGSSLQNHGNITARAGLTDKGLGEGDLFVNISGASITPSFVVNWDGVVPPGNAPVFTVNPITRPSIAMSNEYSATIAGTATDADGQQLTYLKGTGPAWLQVAPDGSLSGTPLITDVGLNTFQVAVTDGTDRYGVATLYIEVTAPPAAPVFLVSPIVKATALVGEDYNTKAQTLEGSAFDLNSDPLTFSKVDGPSWLSVASDGSLSGTPQMADVGTNLWTVGVSDGGLSSTGTLEIVVILGPSLVEISGFEIWNGSNNVHEANGVTLTGSGTPGDPFVYSIPAGMRIKGGSSIRLSQSVDYGLQNDTNHIVFNFNGSNLQIDNGGWIDVGHNSRNIRSTFRMDMGGGGVSGVGKILGIDHLRNSGAGVNVRSVTITNASSVELANVDMHVENINAASPELRIYAADRVNITGTVDVRYGLSTDAGNGGNCFIYAGFINVNNVDTRAAVGTGRNNGNITLVALNAAGGYSTAEAGNAYTNQLVINGTVTTDGSPNTGMGALTMQSVVLRLNPGAAIGKATAGFLTVNVGAPTGSVTEGSLFFNPNGVTVGPNGDPLVPTYDVVWDGALAGPYFFKSPVVKLNARADTDYASRGQSLAADAIDPQWGAKTYAKVSGPGWLSVAADGSLSGTPSASDIGPNTWQVSVTASSASATATLQVPVLPAPGPVLVSGSEAWDGINNPHETEGVELAFGSGTQADPAVYTIPSTLTIPSGGVIQMSPTIYDDRSITLKFTKGDLQIDSGGMIDISRQTRNGRQVAQLDMGGRSITGAGEIVGLIRNLDTPRALMITNASDVYLQAIDVHVNNVNNSGRHMFITASNHVEIGEIDNTDRDTGGNPAGNVTISGGSLTLGSIYTFTMRSSAGANGGAITLRALGAPGFDPADAAANLDINTLVISGTIQSHTNADAGGAVTMQAVHLFLGSGFNLVTAPATVNTFEAGVYPNGVGATESDMFMNSSSVALTPVFDVQWSGPFTPQPPFLQIGVSGNQVVLSWAASGFTLQSNSDLENPAGWVDVPGVSPVQEEIGSGPKYYRLKK